MRCHPRSSRERVEWRGDALEVWVTAPALDDAANRSLVLAISRALGLRPSAVELLAGRRNRTKRVRIDGVGTSKLEELTSPRGAEI